MNTQKIQNLIKEILSKMDFLVDEIDITTDDSTKHTVFSVKINKDHLFTGHSGEALNALNHLVRRIIEQEVKEDQKDNQVSFLIDIGDFQKKRIENIKAVAHMISERARYFKSSAEVEPMSSFDRRIVHEFVANHSDLKSESAGFGPNRHVVIKYVGEL